MERRKVGIFTTDKYLYQKIFLDLSCNFDCLFCKAGDADDLDIAIWDEDALGKAPKGCITVGSGDDVQFKIPLALGALNKAICDNFRNAFLRISEDGDVFFKGRRIPLTECEYSLLSALVGRRGGWASREELNREVWGREKDGSLLNVYVHYLRDKLEKDGEKVIISSHRHGYRIDEKYFGEEE